MLVVSAIIVILSIKMAFIEQLSFANNLKARRVTPAVLKIPVGSTKEQVTAFLKAESLEHSYIGNAEEIDFDSEVANNGYSSANLSGYIVSIVRNTSSGFLVSGDLQYFFFFDKKGKLIKTTAKKVFTGL